MTTLVIQSHPIVTCEQHQDETLDECLFCRITELEAENVEIRRQHTEMSLWKDKLQAKLERVEECKQYNFIGTTPDMDYKYVKVSDLQEAIK